MSTDTYKAALRLGQKEYRTCVAKGEYPYLQVLDEVSRYAELMGEESLGLVDIPMTHIVGTKTEGRRNAFARNFMPLLEPGTEFAAKWDILCDAHLKEGIREPIVAYEFMNRFYVAEGNKRVSVLKFFGSPTVPGMVRRIVPKRQDTPESKIYYDFLDFYRLTQINYVWFSQPGRFRQLIKAVRGEEKAEERWDDVECSGFLAAYTLFRTAYHALGGGKLPITTGDALLVYLRLYGYPALQAATEADIRQSLTRIWTELAAQSDSEPVALALAPSEQPQRNFFAKLLPLKASPIEVAFLHEGSADTSGWTYGHEQGRLYLQSALGERIHTAARENVTPETAADAIRSAAEGGAQVIVTTTPKLMEATLKAAAEYPGVRFFNCSLNTPHPSIRTYYGRMYEAKFLAGVIAGSLSENHKVGYAADYPIYGAAASVNAFALGARMVDPRTMVYLEWSSKKDVDLQERFRSLEVDMVSYPDLLSPKNLGREFGLYSVLTGRPERVAVTRWNWGQFYERMARRALESTWRTDKDGKAINYWWGMSAGVVELVYTKHLPIGTQRLVELLKSAVISGAFTPFAGKLYAQDRIVQEEGELTPEQIIRMDWLAENVSGAIPSPDELTDEAKKLVAVQGIHLEDRV